MQEILQSRRMRHRIVDFVRDCSKFAPQVIAFSTAWSLYALTRLINWEVAMMPANVVWLRAAVSIPLPFLAGLGAMLIGKP